MKEEFREIEGFPNYVVSNTGRVINTKTEKEKAVCIDRKGYPKVDLYSNSVRSSKRIHRLVADAFLPPDQERKEINHIDGNKRNNNLNNLERCTGSENMLHAYKTGLSKPNMQNLSKGGMKGRKNPNAGSPKPVRVEETNQVFKSSAECARIMHLRDKSICDCLKCRQKTHRGYHFSYV